MQYVQGVGLPRSLSCPAGAGAIGAAASAAAAATGATILDYIPRSEHVRVLESRLAAKESDMAVEMNSRVSQVQYACCCLANMEARLGGERGVRGRLTVGRRLQARPRSGTLAGA